MGKKQTNYIDIDLNLVQKQQIRIDGDDNRIIELDTGDLTIINRLKEVYPRLNSLGMKGFEIDDTGDETSEATMDNILSALNAIDKEMRDIINYIFDADIADICLPTGAMYNMRNGEFTFEHILDKLFDLYAENVQKEFNQMSERMKQHTNKYTGK
mgnify:FL=1